MAEGSPPSGNHDDGTRPTYTCKRTLEGNAKHVQLLHQALAGVPATGLTYLDETDTGFLHWRNNQALLS
jgi:hypothetical protein